MCNERYWELPFLCVSRVGEKSGAPEIGFIISFLFLIQIFLNPVNFAFPLPRLPSDLEGSLLQFIMNRTQKYSVDTQAMGWGRKESIKRGTRFQQAFPECDWGTGIFLLSRWCYCLALKSQWHLSFLIGGKKKKKRKFLILLQRTSWYVSLPAVLTSDPYMPHQAQQLCLLPVPPIVPQGHCVDLELAVPSPESLSSLTSPRRCSLPACCLSPPLSHFIEALCPSSVPWKMQLLPINLVILSSAPLFYFQRVFTAWNCHFSRPVYFSFFHWSMNPKKTKLGHGLWCTLSIS